MTFFSKSSFEHGHSDFYLQSWTIFVLIRWWQSVWRFKSLLYMCGEASSISVLGVSSLWKVKGAIIEKKLQWEIWKCHLRSRSEREKIQNSRVSNCPPQMKQTLPKAQRAQGIEYFDSFNALSSKQKLQQALKSWSHFSLVLFGKGREMCRTTLTNPCSNFDRSM